MENSKRSCLMSFDATLKSNPTKKQKSILPNNYQDQAWKKLHEVVIAILTSTTNHCSLEELHQTVENMCNYNLGTFLYTYLAKVCEEYVVNIFQHHFYIVENDNILFLEKLNYHWLLYRKKLLMIRSLFLYFYQTFLPETDDVKSIWTMGSDFFYHHIFLNINVKKRIVDGILLLTEKERMGDTVDKTLLKSMFTIIKDYKLYQDVFEDKFIKITERLYADEGFILFNTLSVSKYLHHIKKRLNEENERAILYLDTSTKWPLIHIVEKHLIKVHINSILKKGMDTFLNEKRLNDLKLMFDLLIRIKGGVLDICTYFMDYIKKHGYHIIIDTGNNDIKVQKLLDFIDRMDNIIKICFQANKIIYHSAKDAYKYVLNQNSNQSAEFIVGLIDSKLQVNYKGQADEGLDMFFDKTIVLFQLLSSKDIFEEFYIKFLIKRLLFGTSACIDAEQSILPKLKKECSAEFTSILGNIFKDMQISKNINAAFKQDLKLNKNVILSDIDVTVNIISMSYWPNDNSVQEMTIPNEIRRYQANFNSFYQIKYKSRVLRWQSTYCHGILRSYFKKGNKELQVSLFQAMVLLLFNNCEKYNFKEIQTKTNMDNLELKETLQSLVYAAQVLIKEPIGPSINDADIFSINDDFSHEMYKVKINKLQMIETHKEVLSTKNTVVKNRQYHIEAAILRIMKVRKTILHNNLYREVFNLLNFTVTIYDIKNRIKLLIERKYMERDKNNINQYNYIL